ncbi:MAG TPA: alkaline phosphatase D family protein [Frankiaceae bacterium]|nr:alkaline phosphatase D family protein [Frankiaceae bacterium]
MPQLVLGPLLRYLDSQSATIWVETDAACTVRVQTDDLPASKAQTFNVCGHHYAIVIIRGLTPGVATAYSVTLDGMTVWPLEASAWPPSTLRPYAPGAALRIAFGSCRAAGPLEDMQWGIDALHALAERMRSSPQDSWPDLLALVGDQVYADDNNSLGHEVTNVAEYTYLYAETWSPEPIRWLLSTVPSAMIFDDHDIRDDWNTSEPWRREMQATNWWQERITSGLLTYWLYQHLGNLSPADLETDPVLAGLQACDGDGQKVLRAHAEQADAAADGGPPVQWSYRRDFGATRLVVLDSRANRVVDGRQRLMVSDQEWDWFQAQCAGDVDHLLIVTSLPLMLPPAVHGLEAFDEALAEGRWGRRLARIGEKVRQGADLEHWAAFETSLQRMLTLVTEVAGGKRGAPPATITFLSGDVHFSYLAQAHQADSAVQSRVLQAVCSPLRNPLGRNIRTMERIAASRVGLAVGRFLAHRAHATTLGWGWDITHGPVFGNTLGELTVRGRSLEIRMSGAQPGPALVQSWDAEFETDFVA